MILDLSYPNGASINDGTDSELCSLQYITVETAVGDILRLGTGALLVKVDIEHAYRNVPVHLDDRHLLGMRWKSIDTTLPFGLRSIFTAIADALEWILFCKGVSMARHYLDDFLTMGRAKSNECALNLRLIIEVCTTLGLPLKSTKIEGPANTLTFLGIVLDTKNMKLPDKLSHLMELLQEWRKKGNAKNTNYCP